MTCFSMEGPWERSALMTIFGVEFSPVNAGRKGARTMSELFGREWIYAFGFYSLERERSRTRVAWKSASLV